MTNHSLSGSAGLLRALAVSLLFHGFLLLQARFSVPTLPAATGLNATLKAIGRDMATDRGPSVGRGTADRLPVAPAADRRVPAVPAEVGGTAGGLAAPGAEAISQSGAPGEAVGPDAAGLRAYRMTLAGELRRFKPDPAGARAAAWSGTADVKVSVDAGGKLESVQLAKSSGNADLDDSAVEMVRNAAPLATVPPPLRGQRFSTTLSIEFSPD